MSWWQKHLYKLTPWDFFGRNDAKAETPVLWPPHAKSWLTGKDPDAGRDWGQEEKGTTEDEMAGWHQWLDERWVWVNSGSWWWTGRPGVLWVMGSQRVRHDWATELKWCILSCHLQTVRALLPLFLIWTPFIYFYLLISVARTSRTMLNNSG